tara:strand:- start:215 stop:445 length:231 start_codon:yes stop_codon:yes gene_type:complete
MGRVAVISVPQVMVAAELKTSVLVLCAIANKKHSLNLVDLAVRKYGLRAVAVSFTRQWHNTASNSQRNRCSVSPMG